MMGIVVPETCWASNKICNKNHLLHLVGILFPHSIYSVINAGLKTAVVVRDIQIFQEVWTFGISIKSRYAATANRGQGRVHVSNKANVISPHAGVARSENCCGVEVTGLM
jgi:hypothetical protein